MLARYAGKIAVVMPYATFGFPIDLEHYTRLAAQLGVPVVVDAAASLGTCDGHGRGFGSGFREASCIPCTPPSRLLWERPD